MAYAERFDQTRKTTFQDQSRLAVQNMANVLRATVTEYPEMLAEQDSPVTYYDPVVAQRRSGRGAAIGDNPANRRRRWLKYQDPIYSGELIDTADKFRGMENFQSPLMQTHTAAVRRGIDAIILEGIFGDAYEGKLGGTVIPGSAIGNVGVTVQSGVGSSAVGMNLRKIQTSRKMFAANNFDLSLEQPYLLLTAQQIDDLSGEIQLLSKDYVEEAGPQFSRDGKLSKVWQHWIVEIQNLPSKTNTTGGGTVSQRNVAFMKSAVALGVWQDVKFDTAVQPQLFNELYMWVDAYMDCRRLDEKGVIEIESRLT